MRPPVPVMAVVQDEAWLSLYLMVVVTADESADNCTVILCNSLARVEPKSSEPVSR